MKDFVFFFQVSPGPARLFFLVRGLKDGKQKREGEEKNISLILHKWNHAVHLKKKLQMIKEASWMSLFFTQLQFLPPLLSLLLLLGMEK